MGTIARMFEHATIEWYWGPGPGEDPSRFQPTFVIFRPDGSAERRYGYSAEVTSAMTELGRQGFEVVACVGVANWLLWTLKRRAS